jgi:hypothetical protein
LLAGLSQDDRFVEEFLDRHRQQCMGVTPLEEDLNRRD